MGVILLLLLSDRGERADPVAGCGQLSPADCAVEAVRLEEAGAAERALLLAYLAPVEEPATRDRVFGGAAVAVGWGSRERFACAEAPTPCNSLDFWRADRDAPGGDRALSALADRCDTGDRDACFLRILVQRRFTLIEPDPPLGDSSGAPDSSGRGAPDDPRGSDRQPGVATGREPGEDVVRGGGQGGEPGRALEPTSGPDVELPDSSADPSTDEPSERTIDEPAERVVGEPDEPAERVVGEPDEPAERVVGESSESTERVVGERAEPSESTERVVEERSERVVGERTERVVEEPPERVVEEPDEGE